MAEKMYTYEFRFLNPVTLQEDKVQKCGKNMWEALQLFEQWCKDEKMPSAPRIIKIMLAYNQDDADEYGENYGNRR